MAKIGRTEGKINLPDYIRVLPILAFYAKVVNFVRYSGCIEKFLEAVLNLFRDRGSIWPENIPACNDNIISQ